MKKIIKLAVVATLMFVPFEMNAQRYVTLPYTTGFEGGTSDSLVDEWIAVQACGAWDISSPRVITNPANARTDSSYLKLECDNALTEIVALPRTQEAICNLRLTFWASTQGLREPHWFEVGVWDSASNIFYPVDTVSLYTTEDWGSGYREYHVYFSNYYGAGDRIAIRVTGFSWGARYTVLLDDITISENNYCYHLSDLHLIENDHESITIGWSDDMNTSPSYTVRYWLEGASDTDIFSNINSTTYRASGLEEMSIYHFSVTANCPTGNSFPLNGTFTTLCTNAGCALTVEMADRYMDGWNGYAGLIFEQNGIKVGTARLPSGNHGTDTVHVCSGVPVTFSWRASRYDNECSYTIYDGGMGVVYNSADGGVNHNDTITSPCPTCWSASGLSVDSTDQNSITISWNADETVSSYNVYLNGEFISSTANTTYAFTDLDPDKAYTLGVQAICPFNDTAITANILGQTDCGTMVLPFFEDFEHYENSSWPLCWHRLHGPEENPVVSDLYPYSGLYSITMEGRGDTVLFCTPSPVPVAGNNIYVCYRAYMTQLSSSLGTKWLKAGVMTDTSDLSTFIVLDSMDNHDFDSLFELRDFHTDQLDSTATYWVAWMYYSSYIPGWVIDYGAVDNILISEIPSCLHVRSIEADTVTDTSITLTWVNHELNAQRSFIVSCWGDSGDTVTVSTCDTFYVFTNLSGNTLYHFSVALSCDTSQEVTASFRTVCGTFPIPYMEDFEHQSIAEIPSCWRSQEDVVATHTRLPHSGTNHLYFHGNATTIAVLPQFTLETNTLQMSFWTRPMNAVRYSGTLSVGFMTDPDDESTFTDIETYDWADFGDYDAVEYKREIVLFCDAPEGVYMAFRHNAEDLTFFWAVDDININVLPDCLPVTHVSASNVTDSSATIHWTPREGQTRWLVIIDSTIYATTDTFYTVTGLSQHRWYTVSVANNCDGDTSLWRSVKFQTECTLGTTEVAVDMASLWNGGWSNYNKINFYQDSILVGYATQRDNHYDSATVEVCCGSPVTFNWEGYNSDHLYSFIIYDANNGVIYNSANGGTGYIGTIDNPCASCHVPSGVRATFADSTSISFAWDVDNSVGGYLTSLDGGPYTLTSGGSCTYTGLTPGSSHTFRVKTLCGITDTSNTVTIIKNTTCGALDFSNKDYFKEDFEACATDTVPDCWTIVGDNPWVSVKWGAWHSRHNSLILPPGSAIATPLVPLAGNFIHVSFWASVDSQPLEAGVMTNPFDESTFLPLLLCPGNIGYYMQYEFSTHTLPHDSIYYVAFRSAGNSYIDDVEIFEDTSIVRYNVTVSANNPAMGTVTGGGTYIANTSITLTAVPNPGFKFVDWNDSVTDPVRTVIVIDDMDFVANFTQNIGIEEPGNPTNIEIIPNPARNSVTLLGVRPGAMVTVMDISGRIIHTLSTTNEHPTLDISPLSTGSYFVQITDAQSSVIRKLIIQ